MDSQPGGWLIPQKYAWLFIAVQWLNINLSTFNQWLETKNLGLQWMTSYILVLRLRHSKDIWTTDNRKSIPQPGIGSSISYYS